MLLPPTVDMPRPVRSPTVIIFPSKSRRPPSSLQDPPRSTVPTPDTACTQLFDHRGRVQPRPGATEGCHLVSSAAPVSSEPCRAIHVVACVQLVGVVLSWRHRLSNRSRRSGPCSRSTPDSRPRHGPLLTTLSSSAGFSRSPVKCSIVLMIIGVAARGSFRCPVGSESTLAVRPASASLVVPGLPRQRFLVQGCHAPMSGHPLPSFQLNCPTGPSVVGRLSVASRAGGHSDVDVRPSYDILPRVVCFRPEAIESPS